jgi:hypothetical protein
VKDIHVSEVYTFRWSQKWGLDKPFKIVPNPLDAMRCALAVAARNSKNAVNQKFDKGTP